jgi:hypothetical protein
MQLFTAPIPGDDFVDSFSDGGGQVVASYPTYSEGQQAIDRLADASSPRPHDRRARSSGGRRPGAWFGLFIGLLVGLFTFGPAWLGLIFGGLLIGALWGALFGFLADRMGSGQHAFASLRSLAASRYDVMVADEYAERARQLLSPWPDHARRRQTSYPREDTRPTLTPTISYPTAQSHIDDLHRDARRHHLYEETRRQMIRLAPPRQVIRRPRLVAASSHR